MSTPTDCLLRNAATVTEGHTPDKKVGGYHEQRQQTMSKPSLTVLLAEPRGFCAGVDRAVQIVEHAIDKYGAPVYVRHEIVHNKFVVNNLEAIGAIFVDELDEVPDGVPVIFSAHGVPKSVPAEAKNRELLYVDATCPLVSKVHREAERYHGMGLYVLLIGHTGHPEVVGTMGQLPQNAISLLETVSDAEAFVSDRPEKLAYLTQTTLSVDDTAAIIGVLKRRFPNIQAPHKDDICYATTNRQQAVRTIAERCDHVLIIGAPNSSNSLRLVEVAKSNGCPAASLVQRARDIDWLSLENVERLGLSAGASAPEVLVDEVLGALRSRYNVDVEKVTAVHENVRFRLPPMLDQ